MKRTYILLSCLVVIAFAGLILNFMGCENKDDVNTSPPQWTNTPTNTPVPSYSPSPTPSPTYGEEIDIEGDWLVERDYFDISDPYGNIQDSFMMNVVPGEYDPMGMEFDWTGDSPTSSVDRGTGYVAGMAGTHMVQFQTDPGGDGVETYQAPGVASVNTRWDGQFNKQGYPQMLVGSFVATKQ